jgi:adenylate kinase
MMSTVVLLGPPGAGKGTQADMLRREYGFVVVASGVLLRRHVAEGTGIGTAAAGYMRRGDLVPEDVVAKVIVAGIAAAGTRPVVIEGYPKTAAQARTLDAALARGGRRADLVLALHAEVDTLRGRLDRRAREEGRADDAAPTARARLDAFGVIPDDLLEHYRAGDVLHELDADRPLPAVSADVCRLVAPLAAAVSPRD